MNDVYFDNVVNVGKLYLEHIFYEFESEPIIFTCIDNNKNTYLCLCSEIRYIQKWIIAKCTNTTLRDLIQKKIDIATAFLKMPDLIIVEMNLQGEEQSWIIETKVLDKLDLPKKGTYIKCNKEKALNYLRTKEVVSAFEKDVPTFSIDYATEKIDSSYCFVVTRADSTLRENITNDNDFINNELEQLMPVSNEYSIYKKEKYIEIIDDVDLSTTNNNYLDAA